MANYLLLYSGGRMPESEAEQAAVMQAWGAWFGRLGSALVDGGNPTTGQAKTISSDGKVSDGSEGTTASGYSMIKGTRLTRQAIWPAAAPLCSAAPRSG